MKQDGEDKLLPPDAESTTTPMAESQQTTASEAENVAAADDTLPVHKSRHCPWTILISCVSLVALAGVIYLGYQQFHIKTQLTDELTAAQQTMTSLQRDAQQRQAELSQSQQQLANYQHTLQSMQQQLQQFAEDDLRSDNHWVLAEVDYLLRLANVSLSFENNLGMTIGLLQTADQRIAGLHDQALLPIREALTEAITQLQSQQDSDVTSVLLKLKALDKIIGNLPMQKQYLLLSESTAAAAHDDAAEKSAPSIWQRTWDNLWQVLQKVVVVQHHDQLVSEQKMIRSRAYFDQHLQLLLMQAQWGVIHDNHALYTASLKDAVQWLQDYYDMSSNKTAAFLQALTALENDATDLHYPDLVKIQKMVAQAMPKAPAEGHDQ